MARSLLSFNSASLAGKTVMSARLELYATHSYSCTARNWEVWSAGAFTEASTVWSNKPAFGTKYATSSATGGFSSACAAGWKQVPILSLAQAWAGQSAGTKTLGIKAESETDTLGWKKFASRESGPNAPKIFFSYNRTPAAPAAPKVNGFVSYAPPGGLADNYIADRTPTLSTSATDADGNTVKQEIQVHASTTGTDLRGSCTTGLVASGASAACTMPTLTDNARYYGRSRSVDQLGATSGWSGWWGFTVTASAPPVPVITCPGYPDGSWTTTVPTTDVTCTITGAGSGASTPGWIHHRVDGADPSSRVLITPSSSTTTAKVTVSLKKASGQHTIRARTESRSGVQSAAVDYTVGWGTTVAMSSPTAAMAAATVSEGVVVTTDTVAVAASGPPGTAVGGGAPTAKVQWRRAGSGDGSDSTSTGWNDLTSALTVTPLANGYSITGSASTAAMTNDNGVALNERVPVRLEVRVCLVYGPSTVNCAVSPGIVQRVPHAFGSAYPVAEAGPGQVALWTGEWTTSETDASVPGYTGDLSVSRTHSTYTGGGSTADPVTGVFGPGWTANFDGSDAGVAGYDLVDNTVTDGTLVLFAADDTPMVFAPAGGSSSQLARRTGASLTAGTWVAADEDTEFSGAVLRVTATGSGSGKAVVTVTLEDGTVTTFDTTATLTTAAAQFSPVSVAEPGIATATTFTRDSTGRVTSILAPVPPGVSCTGAPAAWTAGNKGCRAMLIDYASVTTAAAGTPGDVAGQVRRVSAVLWDPAKSGGAGMASIPVATYRYDTATRLVSVTDPLTGLITGYGYDGSSPRLASLTPPGLTATNLVYAPASESGTGGAELRFARATRDRPAGDPAGGTATLANVVYQVPVTDTDATSRGLPDMTARVQAWQQAKAPTYAAAVFGPDAPIAARTTTSSAGMTAEQLRYGSLQYTDAEGYTVNSAAFGAGAWQLTATDYDPTGNVIRELDERAVAAVDAGADPFQVATLTFYDADGLLVTDTLGPARDAVLTDGSTAWTREWTHTDYDAGTSAITDLTGDKTLNPAIGKPWRLPTAVTSIAVPGATIDQAGLNLISAPEAVATRTGSDVLSRALTSYGTTKASWTLGTPVSSTIDVDASGSITDGDITTQTTYDSEGKTTSTTQPGATPGETSTDAGTTVSRYYTVGTHPLDPACGNRPEWAGLLCVTQPGGIPDSAAGGPGLPHLPGTRTSGYSVWLQPTTVVETSNTGTAAGATANQPVTRSVTTRYDAAGRSTGSHVSTTGSLPGTVTSTGSSTSYDPATGLPSSTSETQPGTFTATGRTTTTGYDGWGRALTYTGDDGLTTTTGYDAAGRVSSVRVPVGPGNGSATTTEHTTTYTYDGTDSLGREERRGLTTQVQVTGLAAQTGAYDGDGSLVHELLPGRIERTRGYDLAGEATEVTYTGPTMTRVDGTLQAGAPAPWFAWAQANDVEGRVRAEWTPDTIGVDPVPAGLEPDDMPVAGQALGYARTYDYDRAERLTRVLDWTRPGPGTGGTDNPTDLATDTTGLTCTARDYTFDTRGRRLTLTSAAGPATGPTEGTCPAAGTTPDSTRSSSYDTADRPLTGSSSLAGGATGSYIYDALGRQLSVPAVDSPAWASGDTTAGPIQIGYDSTDIARTLTQAVTVRTGTTPDGNPLTARVQEATQLSLDSLGRRQAETTTSTPLTGDEPAGAAETISTLTRYYGDTSDNPAWTLTDTPARDGQPATQQRAFTADGIGGYTATVTSDATGALTGASLNIANLHGDLTTTIPLPATGPDTAAGAGPTADTISAWQHTDEYGNPLANPTSDGVHIPKTIGARSGAATTSGPAYGWLGSHERALTTTGLTLMGARLYNNVSASFSSLDPIRGGNTTNYAYPQDPVNATDLDGRAKKYDRYKRYYCKSGKAGSSCRKARYNDVKVLGAAAAGSRIGGKCRWSGSFRVCTGVNQKSIPKGSSGITIGNTLLTTRSWKSLTTTARGKAFLAHEREHYRQWRIFGTKFIDLYLWEQAQRGTCGNYFEIKAGLIAGGYGKTCGLT